MDFKKIYESSLKESEPKYSYEQMIDSLKNYYNNPEDALDEYGYDSLDEFYEVYKNGTTKEIIDDAVANQDFENPAALLAGAFSKFEGGDLVYFYEEFFDWAFAHDIVPDDEYEEDM